MSVTRTVAVALEELTQFPGNARRGDLELVRESLRAHGQYKPIVVQEGTNVILAGNHTAQAAVEEGWAEILVSYVAVDDEQARRINLVDNRSNDVAEYDEEALAALLQDLDGDYTGTGFDDDALDELLLSLQSGMRSGKGDTDPREPPAEPTSRPGDLYLLGDHRLLCGDTLNADDRARLLDGALGDLSLTDPPYLVSYEEGDYEAYRRRRRQDGKKVGGDQQHGAGAEEVRADWMRAVRDTTKPGGCFYVFSPPGDNELDCRLALRAADLQIRVVVLWIKDVFTFGRQDYHWRHEAVMYGWRDGAAHFFVGDRTQDTLWEYERPRRSEEHPTMKPVPLLERAIENSSRKGELVIDLFGGAGSTLIAADNKGRRCAMMELDPAYCDVIVDRWQRHTGEVAQRIPLDPDQQVVSVTTTTGADPSAGDL